MEHGSKDGRTWKQKYRDHRGHIRIKTFSSRDAQTAWLVSLPRTLMDEVLVLNRPGA